MPIVGMGYGPFWKQRFTANDIPDLAGKTAVVTGGTAGIGLETSLQLASHGARVIMLSSTEARGQAAIREIKEKTGKDVEWMPLNLSSIKGSAQAAHQLREKVKSIDILVANAGVGGGYAMTDDGFEWSFGVNHLGHYAFIEPLLDLFTGPDCRIVMLSSYSHYDATKIEYSTLTQKPTNVSEKFGDTAMAGNNRYAVSKTANIMYAKSLSRKLPSNVYVNAVHPGVIRTTLQDDIDFRSMGWLAPVGKFLLESIFWMGLSVQRGALGSLYAATSFEIASKNYRGEYFAPIARLDDASALAKNEAEQEKLMEWTQRTVAERI